MQKLEILTKPIFWVPWFAAMILCYFFVDLPVTISLYHLDKHHPGIQVIFSYINHLGNGELYLFPAGLIFLWAIFIAKNKKIAWIMVYLISTIFISSLSCTVLKILAGRARPYEYFRYQYYGFYYWQFINNFWSFPSGHATTAAAAATALYLTLRRFGILFLLMFILVFCGRVIARAHYISDVMAGGYLGFIVSLFLYNLMPSRVTSRNFGMNCGSINPCQKQDEHGEA